MTPTTDGLAGTRTTTTEEPLTGGVARQAQDRVTEPVPAGDLRGRAAAVPPRAAAAPKTSAGSAGASPVLPAGSRGLSGAEWRKAAAKASRRRPAKVTPKAAAKVTIPPPVAGGGVLTATAWCMGRCDWTAGPGDPAEVDKLAEKHTKSGLGHPTNTVARVAEIGGAA